MSKVTSSTTKTTTTVPKAKTTKTVRTKVVANAGPVEEPVSVSVSEPVPVSEPVSVSVPVSTVTEPVSAVTEQTDAQTTSLKMRFDALIKSKQDLMNDLKREIQELRKMQRDHEHAVRDASKRSKKKKFLETMLILENHQDLHHQ